MNREPSATPPFAGAEPKDGELRTAPSRIDNPFLRFRTRSYWLSAIIRRSRAAEAERTKPDWFNR